MISPEAFSPAALKSPLELLCSASYPYYYYCHIITHEPWPGKRARVVVGVYRVEGRCASATIFTIIARLGECSRRCFIRVARSGWLCYYIVADHRRNPLSNEFIFPPQWTLEWRRRRREFTWATTSFKTSHNSTRSDSITKLKKST